MYNNITYVTKFPNLSELLCVFATINSYENDNTSYYNQIILKCRQLIFEISEIIACPQTDRIYGIHIVVKEDFYKTGELHSYLEKHSLRSGSVQAVQKCIFEKCCLYTIISKLAPKWNQISNYLVHGRNFLTDQCALDSVQLKLNINDKGNTTISLNVNRTKISKITLDDLYLTDNDCKELKTNQYVRFNDCNIRNIQVLPSLKRGKIIALHLQLNKKSSIKTYQEMRRYWKNTYGYRLPETDEDIFYVDISFFEGSQIFTYPNLCVRFYEPIFTQRIDPNPINANFIANLKKYVPIILGENYPFPSHVSSSTDNLLTVSQMVNLPNSCEINTKFNEVAENYSACERALKDENKKETKSKLSQLLEELNKNQNKSTIYLTPQAASNNNSFTHIDSSSYIDKKNEIEKPIFENTRSKNDVQTKFISEDLKKQVDFLTTSISQQTSTSKSFSLNFTNKLVRKNETADIKRNTNNLVKVEEIQLKRNLISPIKENVKIPRKKKRLGFKAYL